MKLAAISLSLLLLGCVTLAIWLVLLLVLIWFACACVLFALLRYGLAALIDLKGRLPEPDGRKRARREDDWRTGSEAIQTGR